MTNSRSVLPELIDIRSIEVRHRLARQLALFCGMMMSGGIFFFPRIPMLVLIVGLVFYLRGPTFGIRRAMAPIWILLMVVLAVSVAASGTVHLADTVIRFANFAGGILLLAIYLDKPRDQLARDYYPIGKLFSIQSILTIIAATVVPGLFMTLASPGDNADYQSLGFVLNYHVMLEGATRFHRPDGFFYEPAVFQIFLNFQLYLALFVFNDRKWAGVALLGVLATQSTTSLLISLILVGVYYIRMFPTASALEKFAGAMLGPVIAIPLLLISAQNLDEKLTGRSAGSAWAREFDAYTGMRIAMNHPILGIGFSRDVYKDKAYEFGYMETPLSNEAVDLRTSGNTNGVVMLFYTMGFPLGFLFLFGMFRQRFFREKILFFAFTVLSLISEPLSLNPFFLMLIFSGMLYVPSRASPRSSYGRGIYPLLRPPAAARGNVSL